MGDGGLSGFALNAALDPERLAADYAAAGRLHIPDFLAGDSAERLHAHLRGHAAWRLHVNQADGKLFELDREAQGQLTPAQREQLDLAVHKGARDGFQFRFEAIRVPDADADRRADPNLLTDFARFLSSPEVIEFLRRVAGEPSIDFADAQATAYGPGHFLTAHDDDVPGKNRRAAYVFNLTPRWRIDWGGMLLFHDARGHVAEGYAPAFNALNLFAVPQPHSVSYVTPFAANRRYAVTGWLRSGTP